MAGPVAGITLPRVSVLFDLLRRRATQDPAAPFVSWYGPGGTRAELSGVTFATSVAKAAGLVTDELELEPRATIRLLLPLHWQLPVWTAAADLAGLTVLWEPGPTADVTVCADVAEAPDAPLVVISAATPFGRPEQPVPAPFVDHFSAALGQPDVYLRVPAEGQWLVADSAWSAEDILAAARDTAAPLPAGARVLVPPGTAPLRAALASAFVPLLTGGSAVLVQAGEAGHIAAVEHATEL